MTLNPTNTNVTTAGAGTLLAAVLIGGFITRSGPGAPVNDTLDTTANILGALGAGPLPATSWVVEYYNTTAYTITLVAGDASTTLTGVSAAIATHQVASLLFTAHGTTLTVQVFSKSAGV